VKKNDILTALIVIVGINACCKPPKDEDQVRAFVVGVDQNSANIYKAVQWIDGKQIFLTDSNNSTASYAIKAIYNDGNFYAFGGKTIPAIYAGGPGGQLPLMWKNGVETALPITYAASVFKDAVFYGNDLYVLTGEMDNTWISSTAIGHVMLYKNGVAIMDKALSFGYSNMAYLRISNGKVYVATNTVTGGFSTAVCYQDGVEIFATNATAHWVVQGLEVIDDNVTVFANTASPNYYCAAFVLGKGEVKITDAKSVIGSFIQDNKVCAVVRETSSYNKDVAIWKNNALSPLTIPVNATYPNVLKVTMPKYIYTKECFVATISTSNTNQTQSNIYEKSIYKSTLPSVRNSSAYDADFY
jgi:hypothetical protein